MTVKELLDLLSKVEPEKKVFLSRETALVELNRKDLTLELWGVTIR